MSKVKNYFFNVYHRNISVNNEKQKESSPGHFYLILESNSKQNFFGKYPENNATFNLNHIIGKGKISTEDEKSSHARLEEYSKLNPSENTFSYKQVPLYKNEYKQALSYAISKSEGPNKEGTYVIIFADCTDFIQAVYHQAGLPLYYTILYTRDELKSYNSSAADFVLLKYASRDTFKVHFNNIEAQSKNILAKNLNIGIDKIKDNGGLDVSMLPTFRVDVKKVLEEFQDRFGYELSDSEEENSPLESLWANKVINNRVNELLSNPEKHKEYQSASITQAMEEMKLVDTIIPGFSQHSLAFAKENQKYMQQFMGYSTSNTWNNNNFTAWNSQAFHQSTDQEEDSEFYTNLGVIPNFDNLLREQMELMGQSINNNYYSSTDNDSQDHI